MKNKKIYIDGLALVEGHFSGIGHYILGILKGMDEILEKSSHKEGFDLEIRVVIPYNTVERFQSFGFKHIDYRAVPMTFRWMSILWHKGKMLPLDIFCGRGVYIFTRFVSMPLIFSKSCVIVYDLSYELYREFTDDKNARFLSKRVPRSIKSAERVITISNHVKAELINAYRIEASDIVVAYPAADQRYFYRRSGNEIKEVKAKYKVAGDYILALSNLEPRKNLESLVEAYCQLPKSLTDKYQLLLVGVDAWKTEKLINKIVDKVGEGYKIIRPSQYVSDEDRPAIISGAKLLVYPSHYEGFGMPPVEALACGTPVIAADNSSLPEAVGKVGTLVNSSDIEGLTEAIKNALSNWQELSKKVKVEGPKQADKFSWAESAQLILDACSDIKL